MVKPVSVLNPDEPEPSNEVETTQPSASGFVKDTVTLTLQKNTEQYKKINSERKKKVLVYGDEYASGFSTVLSPILNQSYHVEGLVKSYAPLQELAKNILTFKMDFTTNDFVIVCLTLDVKFKFRNRDFKEIKTLFFVLNINL